ncbi:hypothetical protein WJX81_001138 [Elliptochloris bilobata]|uniref:Endo-beta-1,6-galactanase-like domain-containing protein n=1 Tax=Elliptochloris bilobata TaxID=381761 RepID=A0AAW1SCV2_9CHLO
MRSKADPILRSEFSLTLPARTWSDTHKGTPHERRRRLQPVRAMGQPHDRSSKRSAAEAVEEAQEAGEALVEKGKPAEEPGAAGREGPSGPGRPVEPGARLVVNPERVQQDFEGWGTSLAWFANIVGRFPDPLRNHLADLLFDAKVGLGMQICRYNIGGSGWDTADVGNFRYGANIESFWGPSGDGNVLPFRGNLRPGREADFVRYLVAVLAWFRDTHALTFRTISPFNEPNTAYWRAGNNQEGCHFDTRQQSSVIERLADALQASGLAEAGVGIAASDETSIDTACVTWNEYSAGARAQLAQINTHSYEEALVSRILRRPGSVLAACCGSRNGGYLASARAELRALVKPSGKRLWASEFGCGTSPLDDMGAAIALSAVILQDLNVLQANAWVYWQAIENSEIGNFWGLIQVPFHTGAEVAFGRQYYAFMQYSRFVRHGYAILESPLPELTLVAASPPGDPQRRHVVVVSNPLPREEAFFCDFSACGSGGAGWEVEVHRTSATEACCPAVDRSQSLGHSLFGHYVQILACWNPGT